MTLFAIYDKDSGNITQANKVYNPEGYDKLLDDRGLTYIKDTQAEHLCSFDHWMVDVSAQTLRERQTMTAIAAAPTIKAGTNALITGIPKGASVSIMGAGAVIYSIPSLDGDELEFPMPVPCKYQAVLTLWPWKDCVIDIEAVA